MLSVAEAQAKIMEQATPLPPQTVALDAAAVGLVLAEDVASDLDMPPYDKALMDGFAVQARDFADGQAVLSVVEEIMAGQTPKKTIASGQAARIMTGAPIPSGADAVVIVERSQILDGNRVRLEDRAKLGQNILPQAREMRKGETVLKAGCMLRPQEFGLLAAVGRTTALVHPSPTVAILSTGDEVVEPSQIPGPGQIRNSNGAMLLAQVCRAGGRPQFLDIARDRLDHLRPLVTQGLQADILVLSGGVSAGQSDLVPEVLTELGVQAHFHKVAMKPGKPVFFGVYHSPLTTHHSPALVFGLPGNPVSSLVCFELFVRPAMRRLQGHVDPGPFLVDAILEEDFAYRTDRPTYYPAQLTSTREGWRVRPVPWFGSADLRGLLAASAFVVFPAGEHRHPAGQIFPVLKVE
jgi:molybdopterin molybdotransferase